VSVIRAVLAALFVALAAAAAYAFAWMPFHCNITERTIQARTDELFEKRVGEYRQNAIAQDNLRLLSNCARYTKTSPNLHLLAAANWSLRGDHEMTLREYETALQYDRRPEFYFNLGMAQLDAGLIDQATKSLETACMFRLSTIDDIPPGNARDEVIRRTNIAYQAATRKQHIQ
jgi:hypothetical protein